MKILIVAAALFFCNEAQAYTTHCQRNGGPEYVCHICFRGSNWMTLSEYECSAAEERRQDRARRARNR